MLAHSITTEEWIEYSKKESVRKIAKKMLEKGSDVIFVSECTGLSIDEVNEISDGIL